MRTLRYQCPDCKRKLAPIEGMACATQVVSRSCKCKAKWQLVVVPTKRGTAWFDSATFTRKGTV